MTRIISIATLLAITLAATFFSTERAEADFLFFKSKTSKETALERAQRLQSQKPTTKYNTRATATRTRDSDMGFSAPIRNHQDPFIHNGPPDVYDKGDYQIVHYEGEVPQKIYKTKDPSPNQVIARQNGQYNWNSSYRVDTANANAGRCLLEGFLPAVGEIMTTTGAIEKSPVTIEQITGKNGPFKDAAGKLLDKSYFVPMGTGDLQTFAMVQFAKGRIVSYTGANGTSYGPRTEPGYTQHLLVLDPGSFHRPGPIIASVKPETNVNANGNYRWHKYTQNVVESIDHFPTQAVPNPKDGASSLTNLLRTIATSPKMTAFLNSPENAKAKDLVKRECEEHALDIQEGKYFNYDNDRNLRTLAGVGPNETRDTRFATERDARITAASGNPPHGTGKTGATN